jgi:hypothetical protein
MCKLNHPQNQYKFLNSDKGLIGLGVSGATVVTGMLQVGPVYSDEQVHV